VECPGTDRRGVFLGIHILGEQEFCRWPVFDDELDVTQLLAELARQPVDQPGDFFANVLMIHRG